MTVKHVALLAAWAVLALNSPAWAADKVKIGLVSTLSGPAGALGVDMRDGFNLALKHLAASSAD